MAAAGRGVRRPRVLIAAPRDVIRLLARALTDEVDVLGAQAHEEAVRLLHVEDPDLVIVCYAFDQMRPFRLLRYIREDWHDFHVPTILVRALPIPLGTTQEQEIRDAYKILGVDEFFNLHDERRRYGRDAGLQRFRDAVLSQLPVIHTDSRDRRTTSG